MYLLIFSRYK